MNSEHRIVFILPLFVSIFLENIRLIAPHVWTLNADLWLMSCLLWSFRAAMWRDCGCGMPTIQSSCLCNRCTNLGAWRLMVQRLQSGVTVSTVGSCGIPGLWTKFLRPFPWSYSGFLIRGCKLQVCPSVPFSLPCSYFSSPFPFNFFLFLSVCVVFPSPCFFLLSSSSTFFWDPSFDLARSLGAQKFMAYSELKITVPS